MWQTVIRLGLVADGMADTKSGREKQADAEMLRQRQRAMEEARVRAEEVEPLHDDFGKWLGEFDKALETHHYPTTTNQLIASYGDREIVTQDGRRSIEDVLGPGENETYDSADEVRARLQGLIHPE